MNKKASLIIPKGNKTPRHVRNVGLGFKTPREVGIKVYNYVLNSIINLQYFFYISFSFILLNTYLYNLIQISKFNILNIKNETNIFQTLVIILVFFYNNHYFQYDDILHDGLHDTNDDICDSDSFNNLIYFII